MVVGRHFQPSNKTTIHSTRYRRAAHDRSPARARPLPPQTRRERPPRRAAGTGNCFRLKYYLLIVYLTGSEAARSPLRRALHGLTQEPLDLIAPDVVISDHRSGPMCRLGELWDAVL